MSDHGNKKTYGVAVLIITAVLMFILFGVLGLNGGSIAAPTSDVLVKLLILLTPTLVGLWLGLALSANIRTATQIVDISPCIYARVHFNRLPTLLLT
jgi:hypothetical protein